MDFKTKNCGIKVKGIDERNREVTLYAAAFNNVDSDGDMIVPSAFDKTIAERGPDSAKPRIKHLNQHWTAEVIGKPKIMKPDEMGLLVVSVLSNSTTAKDVLEGYKLDLYEHSIGYQVEKSLPCDDEDNQKYNQLQELKLWEYSNVTWGANQQTPMIGMKAQLSAPDVLLDELNKRIDKLVKAISNWNGSDERGELFEIELAQYKQINDLLKKSLEGKQPGVDPTDDDKPVYEELGSLIDEFILINKIKHGRY